MNKVSKKIFCLIFLLSGSITIPADTCRFEGATPYFSIRSQSVDSARELVGWTHQVNLYRPCEGMYGSLSFTPEWTKSFRKQDIICCLFGDSLVKGEDCPSPVINIAGSRAANRNPRDWLADNFGLPTDFESTISFRPTIKNFIFDIDYYLGFDECLEGLYFRVHAPVVHTRWRLDYCENVAQVGVNNYDAGYFAPALVPRSNLLESFSGYVSKEQVPTLNGGVVFEALRHAKWSDDSCSQGLKATRLSEIQVAFGWNMWQCEDYHFGFNVRGSIPSGTRPKGDFIFEPVVGNGHHWELGSGLTTHYTFWRDCDCARSVGLYLDANVTHLFNTRQCRTFDLCCKPNSRYMLAERLGLPVENGLKGSETGQQTTLPTEFTSSNFQFKNRFTPVANLTHLPVKVGAGVQADLTLLLDIEYCGWNVDMGYNFWIRSCEKIRPDCSCPSPLDAKTWALKGDSHVFGYELINGSPDAEIGATIALGATQSTATIYTGNNWPLEQCVATVPTDPTQNPGIDFPEFAYAEIDGNKILIDSPILESGETFTQAVESQTRTSIQSVFLSLDDVDFCAARTKGKSHKLFAHVGHTWCETDCGWIPYFGIGGKAEWAANRVSKKDCFEPTDCPPECPTACDSCKECAVSEWGVWLKGGVSFN
jgi:hypothetical protein